MSRSLDELVEISLNSLKFRLSEFTDDQLRALLQDDVQLTDLCQSLSTVSSLIEQKETVEKVCISLAETNLSEEPRLNAQTTSLEREYSNVLSLQSDCEELKREYDEISEQRRLDLVADRLRAAVKETEDSSEDLSDSFLNNSISIETFVDTYERKRQKYHEREYKSNKLDEILRYQHY